MAQRKLLYLDTDGIPVEHNAANDDLTVKTITAKDAVLVDDPNTGYLNQTDGPLVFNDIMAKDRTNIMDASGDILFPVVSNLAADVDAFRLPTLAGSPSATPAQGGAGYLLYDTTNKKLFAYDGTAWDDLSTVSSADTIESSYTAGEIIALNDALYISAANTASKALADNTSKSFVFGFAKAAAAAAASVAAITSGQVGGFSGLTAGSRYYLDGTTAGAIASAAPTGAGKSVTQVGYAKNSTTLNIQFLQLGRRA